MNPTITTEKNNSSKVTHFLKGILADEFVLCLKTRSAHWNVEGPDFNSMHKFFESQFEQLDVIIDEVAERIRTLGDYAPASIEAYSKFTYLTEKPREENDSIRFIKDLLGDHEIIISRLKESIDYIANELKDAGTSDFITSLLGTHQKMGWMLRAHSKEISLNFCKIRR